MARRPRHRHFEPRLIPDRADYSGLWNVVARHRAAAGDRDGAAFARWQARSIRSAYPVRRAS